MKNTYLLLILFSTALFIGAANGYAQDAVKSKTGQHLITLNIDNQDSVFFDLFNATVAGTTIEFPVSVKSDDVINALDFSFRYNEAELEFDTILNLTNYIQDLSFYNPADSTVRFTSYSFTQPFTNDTPLVVVRFTILTGVFCSNDLLNTEALLNGDGCAEKIIECQSTGIQEPQPNVMVNVFPNPAQESIFIDVNEKSKVDIYDTTGRNVLFDYSLEPGFVNEIPTGFMNNGIYFLKVKYESRVFEKKLVIQHF